MGNTQDSLQNIQNDSLDMQLVHAAQFGDEQLLSKLLETEQVVSKETLQAPLLMAAKEGYPECVTLLLEAGALVNGADKDDSCWTPLWVATYEGNEECVQLLLDWGAELEVKSPETPLFIAAREGKLACLEMLIKAGADVNVVDKDGRSPLHIASIESYHSIAEALIHAGCELESVDSHGNTPLLLACIHSDYRLLEILLRAGASHSHKATMSTMPGYTAMHICASKSKIQSLQVLWNYGADLGAVLGDGMLPRDLAVISGCSECLILLEQTVRSLKSACRLKIRKLCKMNQLDNLNLPEDLKKYLRYEIA